MGKLGDNGVLFIQLQGADKAFTPVSYTHPEQGWDLEVTEFDDYVLPNEVVESGEMDANYFQHVPYLDSFNAEKGTHLVEVGKIHYEPFGIYPGTKASLDDIADGDTIAVPVSYTHLLKEFHPDYNPDAFAQIKVGANKGQKAPLELAEMLHSTSRLIHEKIDLTKIDYDVDVLVIGGGGAGSSCAIEAHNAGADVMIVTKLRIGDANTMMAEGGIQAADKENDSPVQHYLDCFGGGHFAAKPELVKRLVMDCLLYTSSGHFSQPKKKDRS